MIDQRLQDYFSVVRESSLFKNYYKNVDEPSTVAVMEKHVLRDVLETEFNLQLENRGVYLVRSGGSTDKPLIFPVDIKENLYQREILAQQLIQYGMFSSKTIALNLFSYCDMYRSAGILDDILERCQATTIPLGSKSSFDFMHTTCLKFKPNMLIGTPSVLTLFAQYLSEQNLSISVDHLMFAGEYVLDSQVKLFQKVFHTQRIYSLYGSAETGIWGWSTYSGPSTSFEILDDIIVEIANPDTAGNGTIIVTNLLRKRFPVFRYTMGDIGRLEYKNNKRILTLKSREPKSFSIEANSYFLNDFDGLLNLIDRFQIQLYNVSAVLTRLKFLIVKADCKKDETHDIEQMVIHALHQTLDLNPSFLQLEVELVSESDLYANPTTSKTPAIVDFRD